MDLTTMLLTDLGLQRGHGHDARTLLRLLGAAQDGQFSTRQAAALDINGAQVLAVRDAREIEHVRYGCWRFVAASGDADPAVTAFVACWPWGVISHMSAARFHGLRRVSAPPKPHITVPRQKTCRPAGLVVHHTSAIRVEDVVRVGPLRYMSLARTALDLADPHDPWETLSILDDCVALGVNLVWLHQRATEMQHGRGGVDLIARATSPGASAEFRSWLERAASHVFALGGLPAPEWNCRVSDARGVIGVVDALWRPYHVACELNGLRFHTTPAALQRDHRKRNRLGDAGIQLRVFTWQDLVEQPVELVHTLARALRAGGAAVDLAAIPRRLEVPPRPFV